MFNIPRNTCGAMDSSSLLSLNQGMAGAAAQQQPMQQQPMQQQQFQQQPMQQQFQQQPMQQQFQQQPMQQQPVQQQFQQQPMQQQFQQQPMQQQPVQPRQRPAGQGVHLKKGQKVALGNGNTPLTGIKVCLGWDILNTACDLDASAFMLGADGRVIGDDWFVFYGQPVSPDGSVRHSGDSTNGAAVGDDEIIDINLQTINPNTSKIVFVVTINEALERGLNFSMVTNAYVRVVDTATNTELVKFTLSDYYATVTSMVVGEVYNHNGAWKFNAVGDGVAKDLAGLCAMYGVNVAD